MLPEKREWFTFPRFANKRIDHVEDVLTLGDEVTVVCLGKTRWARISFSMKDVK